MLIGALNGMDGKKASSTAFLDRKTRRMTG
jgi:hypothetical protein